MTTVGVVGGSGYMGGEALRVLLKHPHARIAWATSRTPGPVEQVHPNLYGTGLKFERLEDVATPDFENSINVPRIPLPGESRVSKSTTGCAVGASRGKRP